MRCPGPVRIAAIAAGLLATGTLPAGAQGVRITGTTTARYLELRPMVDDSVPADSATGEGTLRETSRGVVAFCGAGEAWCHYKRTADDPIGSLPLLQDLDASLWGLGEGVHARVHLRGRVDAGTASSLWPQGDDAFDVIAAYVSYDRDRVRARLGRQWRTSGLGYTSFDGLAVEGRLPILRDALSVDGWVGRSLVQGLHEPVSSGAIAAVEDLAPERAGVLIGAQAHYRPRPGAGVSLAYQRELRSDRSWLYSERMAADASMRIGRSGSLEGALELDLATGDFNEARIRGQHPVGAGFTANAQLRRYRPFFELWTIWGAFSPVGFTEASGGLAWTGAASRIGVAADAGWRRYDEPDAGADFLAMKSDGWRLGADAQWRVRPAWVAHGSWRTDIGFGASRTDGDLGVRWQRGADAWLGAVASAFQSVGEFRVGTGRVVGVGFDGGVRVRDDVNLSGDAAVYRHVYGDLAPATDWSQLRGSLRIEWTIGADPGMTAQGAGR